MKQNTTYPKKITVEASRLGIPILFQGDIIHGYNTIAPLPLAEVAREASPSGLHLTFTTMVDATRNPRWE